MSFLGFDAMKRMKVERAPKGPRKERHPVHQPHISKARAHVTGRHTGGRH